MPTWMNRTKEAEAVRKAEARDVAAACAELNLSAERKRADAANAKFEQVTRERDEALIALGIAKDAWAKSDRQLTALLSSLTQLVEQWRVSSSIDAQHILDDIDELLRSSTQGAQPTTD